MSQHYFATLYQGRPITVLMGWDRPLGSFFLVIEFTGDEQSESCEDDGLLYSNLNDVDAWQKPLSYYREKLAQFGIAVPESMFSESLRDEAFDVGNRHVWHEADSTFNEAAP